MRFFRLYILFALWMTGLFAANNALAQHEVIDVPVHFGHPDIEVWTVAKDQDQLLYLSTNHGWYRYDGRNLEALQWKLSASRVRCSMILGDSLISGHENGILTVRSCTDGRVLSADTVSRSAVNAIVKGGDGRLLLATAGSGVCAVFPNGEKTFFAGDLSDDFVNDVVPLSNGEILVSTDRGVDALEMESGESWLHKKSLHRINDLYTSAILLGDTENTALVAGLATGIHIIAPNRRESIVSFVN